MPSPRALLGIMMEDIIKAQMFIDAIVSDEIRDAKKHITQSPKANGYCLYCEEQLEAGIRFCDMDCAADAERYGTYNGGYIPIDKNRRIKNGKRPNYLTK